MQNNKIFMDVKVQLQFLRLTVMSGAHLTMRQCVKQSSLMVPLCWFRYICSSGKRWAILLLALSLKQYDMLCQQKCLDSWICTMKFANIQCSTHGSLFSWEPNIIMDFSAFQSCNTRSRASCAKRGGSRSWSGISESERKKRHTHIKKHKTHSLINPAQ